MAHITIEPAGTETHGAHRSAFFRQGGWMMIATVAGGVFMALLNLLSSKWLPADEYSSFGTLLQVVNWMSIPALGLQMVFAQQTSGAVNAHQRRQLVGTAKAVMRWTFGIWVLMAVITIAFNHQVLAALKVSNPMALWLTIAVGFVMLWYPIFQGLLQGRQNFMWLGWTSIFNGMGRIVIGGVIYFALHGLATGLMAGVLIGLAAALGTSMWHNRDLLGEAAEKFDAPGWLKRVVPLTLGFGVSQFLFSADAIVVQNYLGEGGNAAPYIFGGTLTRAIVLFTGPLAVVMFPKLVQSAARSQKSNLMIVTLLGTAVLNSIAVFGLILTAPYVIKYGSNPANAAILPDLPLFAWTMVPLGVGNVLLYNLMAHSRFRITPALVLLAVGYWIALQQYHATFRMVIQTLGIFALLYLGIGILFTWVIPAGKKPSPTHVGK